MSHPSLRSVVHRTQEMKLTEVSVRLAIQMDPEDPDAHSNLGMILFNDGKVRCSKTCRGKGCCSVDALKTVGVVDVGGWGEVNEWVRGRAGGWACRGLASGRAGG